MSTNSSAVSVLAANLQANLNGHVDHFPAQNDNVKTASETTIGNRKEKSLRIVF